MGIIYHKGVPYASGTINEETPYGTSAPSGGSDGDLYVQIDNNGNIVKVWQNHNNTWGYLSGGETYTAGTNISIDNNVISAIDTNEVSGLNDVEITNLDDGQVLKWDGTNEKWVNDDEAGGLTPVEMDYEDWLELPQSEREDPNIEYFLSNAPGDGGGSSYSETILWENSSGLSFNGNNQQTITLSDNMSNYDMLCLVYRDSTYATERALSIHLVSEIDTAGNIGFWLTPVLPENNLTSPRSYYVSDNQIRLVGISAKVTMVAYKIIGIKFGGGGGSEVIPNPQGTATDTLNTVEIDGTVYDVEGGGGSNLIIDAQKYSLDEQVVGIWIDGKPLYQKTLYSATTVIGANTNFFDLSALDIDEMVDWHGNFIRDGKNYSVDMVEKPSSSSANTYARCRYVPDTKQFAVNVADFSGYPTSFGRLYVTIQYTKTTDTAGSGGYQAYGFSPIIYSDTEREVGVWRDNKPLYAKTVTTGGSVPSGATLIHREALEGYDCIYYTKTTDVAGSGDYNTLAIPNVHYSTDEQVIGTWVDGKTLYQRTWQTTAVTGRVVDLSGVNVEKVIYQDAFIMSSDGNNITPHGGGSFVLWNRTATSSANPNNCIMCTISNSSYNNGAMYVTLQYTKTTD